MKQSDNSIFWISGIIVTLIALTAIFGHFMFRKHLNQIGANRYCKYAKLEMKAIKDSLEEGIFDDVKMESRDLMQSDSGAVKFISFLEMNNIKHIEAPERYLDEYGTDYLIAIENGAGRLIAIGPNRKFEGGGGDDIVVEFRMNPRANQ